MESSPPESSTTASGLANWLETSVITEAYRAQGRVAMGVWLGDQGMGVDWDKVVVRDGDIERRILVVTDIRSLASVDAARFLLPKYRNGIILGLLLEIGMSGLIRLSFVAAIFSLATSPRAFSQSSNGFDYYGVSILPDSSVTLKHYHSQTLESATARPSKYVRIYSGAAGVLDSLNNTTINEKSDLDSFIIRNGLGDIIGSDAPRSLMQEQTTAKARRIGMWASLPQPDPAPQPDPVSTNGANQPQNWAIGDLLNNIINRAYQYWKELVAAGLFGGVFAWFYRKFYVERRVVVSVVGLKGSGKSSVLSRFNNPNFTEEMVSKASPTISKDILPSRGAIRIGRYEVFSKLQDNPGESWGEFFRAVSNRGRYRVHVALLVLAPTDEIDATSKNWRKDDYIQRQIGLAEGLIGGALQAKGIRKPNLVIIFLNKFDLLSPQSPDDSTSRSQVSVFKDVFSQLLKQKFVTDNAGKRSTTLVRVIVGSALKDWGNNAIKSAIEDVLYA